MSITMERPTMTAEELCRLAREYYDTLMFHCHNCLDCRVSVEGRPVIKPGFCERGGDLRIRYEEAYRLWYPYSGY
ncbi:hypothetical protein KGQ20_13955 [Catenulispora sp. NF23]|uniref:hypothetical protein n=1 Tax=Catenulispora pinistramenti TaxID=2705254 RepID=UPI001BAB8862|nr:hypothetical protein [Catenulispora pinistramenti]MBS2533873.1 hypothetical protein [Catenulispora pinistramenti]